MIAAKSSSFAAAGSGSRERAGAKPLGSGLEAYRHTRRFDPDLWLTYHSYYKSPDLMGPVLSRLHHIPYVIFQPMYSTRRRKTGQTRVGFYLNRLALKAATEVFTNNLNDLEALGRLLPPDRITYLPPGINPEAFQRDEGSQGTHPPAIWDFRQGTALS